MLIFISPRDGRLLAAIGDCAVEFIVCIEAAPGRPELLLALNAETPFSLG